MTEWAIIERTNELALAFGKAHGYKLRDGLRTYDSGDIRVYALWQLACIAQDLLCATDPKNALAEMEEEGMSEDNYCIEEDLAESYAREKRLEERLDILRKCQQRFIHLDQLFSTMDTSDPFKRALHDIWVTMATVLREDL